MTFFIEMAQKASRFLTHSECVEKRLCPGATVLQEKRSSFLSAAFPMFVPSLSW
jgi:hypothetical protein